MPWTKGGQPLEACVSCFKWRVSCWTLRCSGKKGDMKSKRPTISGESSDSDEGGDESRRRWLTKFSTIKVGLPMHIKPMTEPKCGLGGEVEWVQASRPAGLEVKRKLKRLCKYHIRKLCSPAHKKQKSQPISQTNTRKGRVPLVQNEQQLRSD